MYSGNKDIKVNIRNCARLYKKTTTEGKKTKRLDTIHKDVILNHNKGILCRKGGGGGRGRERVKG